MNIYKKHILLLLLLPVVFLHGCKEESNLEVTDALDAHIIFLNSSLEASIDTLDVDSSLTVIDNDAVTEVFHIGQSNRISLDVVSPNSNVVAVGLRFGESDIINFSTEPDVFFALSGNICDDLAPICSHLKIYEYGLTNEGKISVPKIQDAVLICGNCCGSGKEQPAAGSEGNPRFNLTFSKGASIKLYVEGPSQDSIGIQDVRWSCLDCDIGANENIYWEKGASGEYRFWVKYEDYCVADLAARFKVTVTDGGETVMVRTGSLSPGDQTGPDPLIYLKP